MPKNPILLLLEDGPQRGLAPLSLTRPSFELRSGALNLRERAELVAPGRVRARVRSELFGLLQSSLPDLCGEIEADDRVLLVNARLRISVEELAALYAGAEQGDRVLLASGPEGVPHASSEDWAAAWLSGAAATKLSGGTQPEFAGLARASSAHSLFAHPWDHIGGNEEDLRRDFASIRRKGAVPRRIFGTPLEEGAAARESLAESAFGDGSGAILYPGVHILDETQVLLGAGAKIKPGVVLDAESGPILIGAGALIQSNVTIQGPAYLGPGCVVHPMTRLREGVSIGAMCKLGGEIEETIMLDFSNKQHDGFLGHAYLGSWVNLGADTNASDLKNNYSMIRVNLGEGEIETHQRFVGPILGDHVRCAINTMFNTGSVVGVCANVFGAGFPPRFIPSFRWGGSEGLAEYELEKALSTARIVLSRRQAKWSSEYEELLRRLHATGKTTRGMPRK
jgi:UDP-N-acetylglucosamine diphosphorylase/glucosamine-1-phosphate N-acetyltransferase